MRAVFDGLEAYDDPAASAYNAWRQFPGNNDKYFDDNGWMTVALTEAFEATRDTTYQDRAAAIGRLKSTRDTHPDFVIWTQSDNVLKRCYWIEAPSPVNQGHIEAKIVGNNITLKAQQQTRIALWLDAKLVNLKKPVTVAVEGGKTQTFHLKPSLETYCVGLETTADPHLSAPVRIDVDLTP